MRKVLVTGARGFVGQNLTVALSHEEDIDALEYDVEHSAEELHDLCLAADFVVHLAGVNRPENPEEFAVVNAGLTVEIVEMLAAAGRQTPLLLASSIQAERDNPYGLSKRRAEDAVFAYGKRTGAPVYVYRLPNLFGKWCRPNYNSVVATFCHNIAHGLPIQINDPAAELTLAYIDDVVAEFLAALRGEARPRPDGFYTAPRTYHVTLQGLADVIYSFRDIRETGVLPDLADDFTRCLHATYLSYLPPDELAYPVEMKADQRGWLFELLKSPHIGQIFVSVTRPGVTRGNHWHHTKVEKFVVVQGQAVIRFRKINGGETLEYAVSGERIRIVDIPPGYTHHIENTGERDLVTVFWASEVFDAGHPDTYYLEV